MTMTMTTSSARSAADCALGRAWGRSIQLRCTAAALFAAATVGLPAIACERTLVLDVSGLNPPGVLGEVIGISTVEGEIVGASLEVTFVSDDPSDWFLALDFLLPTGAVGISSVAQGWTGVGTFSTSLDTDALNGPVSFDQGQWFWTWFIGYAGGSIVELEGGGEAFVPIDGIFETLILTLHLDCSSADLNGDGIVDGADLGILLGAWGPCEGCPADLNGDGTVDGADLGELLQAWTVSDRF